MSTLLTVVALLIPAAARASLTHTIDQLQPDTSGGFSFFDGQVRMAQTFTAGITGYLDQVDLYLDRNPAAADALAIQIQTVNAGGPTGTVLASASVQPADVPPGGDWVSIPIGPTPVVAGTQYAIVAALPEASSDLYAWSGAAGDVYPGGDAFIDSPPPGGGWVPTADDHAFRTYVFIPTVLDFTDIANFTISRDGTRIALVGTLAGVRGLYRADRDGSQIVLLAGEGSQQLEPCCFDHPDFSPNGEKIVYAGEQVGGPTGGSALYVIDSAGGNPPVSQGGPAPSSPRYSPSGARIVFSSQMSPTAPGGFCDFVSCAIYDLIGNGSYTLLFDGYPSSVQTPTYSNDGTRIFFSIDGGIYSMPASGGAPTTLIPSSNALGPESSYAATNAGRVVFHRDAASIWTMDADGTALQEELSGIGSIRDVHWTPAGRIAYLSTTTDAQGTHLHLHIPLDPTSASVPPGGSASSLPNGPTEFAPVASTVTTPNAGTVTIETTDPSDPPPSGYGFVGQQVEITAPGATAADPLVLVFQLDSSLLADAGVTASTVELFRNALRLLECGAPGASPDPCVGSRETLADGDARLTVRTSQASQWNFGKPVGATAVRLTSFSATRSGRGVLLRWRTASEANTLGFNVYRHLGGKLVKLSRALIPSVFGDTASGHAYSWIDRSAPRGAATYRLQVVGLDGARHWLGRVRI